MALTTRRPTTLSSLSPLTRPCFEFPSQAGVSKPRSQRSPSQFFPKFAGFSPHPMSISGIQGQLLEITVVECSKLRDTEWFSRQDPYVCLEYGSTKFRTRTCKDGGKNPVFQEKFVFTLIEGLREINVVVWNKNTLTYDDLIGSGKIQLQDVLLQGFDDRSWPLQTKTGRYAGEIKLIMHYAQHSKPAASYTPSAPPYTAPPPSQVPPYPVPPPSASAPPYTNPTYPSPSTPYPSQAATYPPPSSAYPPPSSMPCTSCTSYPPPQLAYPPFPYPPPPNPSLYPPPAYPPPCSYPPPPHASPYVHPGSYSVYPPPPY